MSGLKTPKMLGLVAKANHYICAHWLHFLLIRLRRGRLTVLTMGDDPPLASAHMCEKKTEFTHRTSRPDEINTGTKIPKPNFPNIPLGYINKRR